MRVGQVPADYDAENPRVPKEHSPVTALVLKRPRSWRQVEQVLLLVG